jgi:Transcriptional regulators
MTDSRAGAERDVALYFELFNEIGILQQLSKTKLESVLPEGLIQSHFGVLSHLIRVQDGRTPLELARAFQVPKTSMSHTVAGLERQGLVRLARNDRDGRSKRVWITEAGREVRDAAVAAVAPLLQGFAAAFPPERVQTVLPELTRMRQWLDAERDG